MSNKFDFHSVIQNILLSLFAPNPSILSTAYVTSVVYVFTIPCSFVLPVLLLPRSRPHYPLRSLPLLSIMHTIIHQRLHHNIRIVRTPPPFLAARADGADGRVVLRAGQVDGVLYLCCSAGAPGNEYKVPQVDSSMMITLLSLFARGGALW